MNIFYNLLKANKKDSNEIYGKILDCELNSDGEINPITILVNFMEVFQKGMAGFSLFLALAVFGEIAARAFIECKYLQESPEIKEDTAYRITKVLRLLCEIILIIGVWRIRFK